MGVRRRHGRQNGTSLGPFAANVDREPCARQTGGLGRRSFRDTGRRQPTKVGRRITPPRTRTRFQVGSVEQQHTLKMVIDFATKGLNVFKDSRTPPAKSSTWKPQFVSVIRAISSWNFKRSQRTTPSSASAAVPTFGTTGVVYKARASPSA